MRRAKRPKRVDALLAERSQPRNALERLVRTEELRAAYTDQLRAVLPPALAPHCAVAALDEGRMTIQVAGAGWATRLRMALPKLEPSLRRLADFAAVREIRIRASPGRQPTTLGQAG